MAKDKELDYGKKVELRAKERDKLAEKVEQSCDQWLSDYKALIAHDHETYHTLAKPDALFYDSPISPSITSQWMKEHILKQNVHEWTVGGKGEGMKFRMLPWAGVAWDGEVALKIFTERMSDATRWILKFTKKPEEPKTGLEAIV